MERLSLLIYWTLPFFGLAPFACILPFLACILELGIHTRQANKERKHLKGQTSMLSNKQAREGVQEGQM